MKQKVARTADGSVGRAPAVATAKAGALRRGFASNDTGFSLAGRGGAGRPVPLFGRLACTLNSPKSLSRERPVHG